MLASFVSVAKIFQFPATRFNLCLNISDFIRAKHGAFWIDFVAQCSQKQRTLKQLNTQIYYALIACSRCKGKQLRYGTCEALALPFPKQGLIPLDVGTSSEWRDNKSDTIAPKEIKGLRRRNLTSCNSSGARGTPCLSSAFSWGGIERGRLLLLSP